MRGVTLADGRRLAYSATGPRGGHPVFYLHGAIGSPPRSGCELDAVVSDLGLRYLMVSRPGFGGSDPSPDRGLLDFADDLVELADALGLDEFGVVGVSAGGPYAIACAHALPDRVSGVAAVSSMSHVCPPWAVAGLSRRVRLALHALAAAPRTVTAVGDAGIRLVERHPGLLLRAMTLSSCDADRELLAEEDTAQQAVDGFLAATSGGVGGLIEDYLVCARPWGFDLDAVRAPVQIWHGARDTLVPATHAVQLAAALPVCTIRFDADDGHFFFRRRLHEILGGLAPVRRPTLRVVA